MNGSETLTFWGALCFGIVTGWICYRTLRRNQAASGLSDIATVIGAIGGAAITGIWKPGTNADGRAASGELLLPAGTGPGDAVRDIRVESVADPEVGADARSAARSQVQITV